LLFDKLGSNYTKTVYWLKDARTPVRITDPAEVGKFFAESVYVIDVKGTDHRYFITWMGQRLTSELVTATSEGILEIAENLLTSDMTTIRVNKGSETEELLRFFPDGFVVLDEARVPINDFYAKANEKGAMFRV